MKHFAGQLIIADSIPGRRALERDWSGHQIALHYATRTQDAADSAQLHETRIRVASDGSYQLRLNDSIMADGKARLTFMAPSGEHLMTRLISDLVEANRDRLSDVALPRPVPDFKPSALALAALTHQRITGRIMAPSGSAGSAANQSVRLQVQFKDDTPKSVWTGVTDKMGYFTAEVQNRNIELASVVLGRDGAAQTLDILVGADGTLPKPLILIAQTDLEEPDCGCGVAPPLLPDAEQLALTGEVFSGDLGTSCQPMTVPNRTLEEFDFFQIVRTTDPTIRGMQLPGERTSTMAQTQIEKIVFDVNSLAKVTGASDIVVKKGATDEVLAAERTMQPEYIAAERMLRSLDPRSLREADVGSLLREQISVDPLSVAGVGTSALWRAAASENIAVEALNDTLSKIPAAMLAKAIEDPDGFTPDKVMTLERRAAADGLRKYLGARAQSAAGRAMLNEDNRIDWDHTPEFYQATSVAHGHILQFKQEWKADGYSLGDLVQSIPLAPGQQKQIVTLDWDRDDRTTRREFTSADESLSAEISRDRDISEIIDSTFTEDLSGSSRAKTGAVGGGLGLAIGPLVIGGGGGSGWASSSASQDSTRDFAAQSMNNLRDQTSQAVSTVRNQRSTVVNTVAQSENVTATTETIANYNRCHALTIQYFEVLRHFAVQEKIAGVKECLFVPLEMALFDDAKVMRWRDLLSRATPSRSLRRGYEAIDRLGSVDTTPPDKRFADDPIETMSGRLRFRVAIARPKDPDDASRAVLETTQWGFLGMILGVSPETIYEQYSRNDKKKDRIYQSEIAPKVAREFLNTLEIVLIDQDGQEHSAEFDLTVASKYQENGIMEVVLNDNAVTDRLPRAQIVGIEVRAKNPLPDFSKVILEDARITYRTERIGARLFSRRRILDDVLPGDPAFLDTSDMSWLEERNQLAFERKKRRRLLKHLNDNIEYFHRAIWLGMDANRRYMLLDGFEAPNAGGRSIASVVENRIIGVVGNCLVMPVAPGFQLDPVLREVLEEDDQSQDILTKLYSRPPSPPRRHSVPSRGVFGEAVAGTCNSCEVIDEDRFWRWSDYPLPDSPPAIASLSTNSRFAATTGLSPTPFPDALIKYQTVPDAPLPTGMSAALGVLGKDVFKDLTGLSENQKNALAALTASMTSAEAFAGEAVELAIARDKAMSLDRTLAQIDGAKKSGYLNDKEASQAARDAIIQSFGGKKTPTSAPLTASKPVADAITQAAQGGSATVTRQNGEDVETVSVETEGADLSIGKAPVAEWLAHSLEVKVPIIRDGFVQVGAIRQRQEVRESKTDAARRLGVFAKRRNASGDFVDFDAMGIPVSPVGPPLPFDMVQSAMDAGHLIPDPAAPDEFLIKVKTRIGYPAKSGSTTTPKAVHFPHSGKRPMPLLVIVHGQAASYVPTGKPSFVSLGANTVAKGTLNDLPNHEGYKYLQDHLALQTEPVVTLSISTNMANAVNSFVEMRAEIINACIAALKAEIAADPKHVLRDAIDFDTVGLLGHSRGGEAVVRAYELNRVGKAYGIKGVMALAPTDFTGATATDKVAVDDPDTSLLVAWGGLDGDVSGARFQNVLSGVGTGQRLYDRCKAHKAFVLAPTCCHNGFNNPVWNNAKEWRKSVGGVASTELPANLASDAEHEAFLKDYAWSFFDLTLNGNAAQQGKFRGETRNASPMGVIQQWNFGAATLMIDDFEQATANFGTRSLGVGMSIAAMTDLTPPNGTGTGDRNRHTTHATRACIVDVANANNPSILSYDLRLAPNTGMDASAYDYLTLRIGQLRDPTDQNSLNALPVPQFNIKLTDGSGLTAEEFSDPIYQSWPNPLAMPMLKKKTFGGSAQNITQMVMHTFAITPKTMAADAGDQSRFLDTLQLTQLDIEVFTGAGTGEIWIDTIQFVKK